MRDANGTARAGQGRPGAESRDAAMSNKVLKRETTERYDLDPNARSLEITRKEYEIEPHFGRLWLYVRESGKLAKMSGPTAKVYMALVTRADWTTYECFPSYETIRKDSGVGRAGVARALKALLELELIAKQKRRQGTRNTSNRYIILKPPTVPNENCEEKAIVPKRNSHDKVTVPTRNRSQFQEGRFDSSRVEPELDSFNDNHLTTTTDDQQQLFDLFVQSKKERASQAQFKPKELHKWINRVESLYGPKAIASVIKDPAAGWADNWAGLDTVLSSQYKTRQETAAAAWAKLDAERKKTADSLDNYLQMVARQRERGKEPHKDMLDMIEVYQERLAGIEASMERAEAVAVGG